MFTLYQYISFQIFKHQGLQQYSVLLTESEMEDIRKRNKQDLLATDIGTDNLDDEVTHIYDKLEEFDHEENNGKDRLSVGSPANISRSPVTVQEWVAALPDQAEEKEEKEQIDKFNENDGYETDTLSLGAEAGYIQPQNAAKLLLANKYKTNQPPSGAISDKRRQFQHSDTAASLKSNLSVLSTSRYQIKC